MMNIVTISGSRQTGKTTILKDIGRRSIIHGLKVVVFCHNQDQLKLFLKDLPEAKGFTSFSKFKSIHANIILIDEVQQFDRHNLYNNIYPISVLTKGIVYQTKNG